MIFNVLWTMFFFRGARPRRWAPSPTRPARGRRSGSATCSPGCRPQALEVVESVGLLLHIGVMLAFLIIVAYSKHLHIFLAPINVSAKRLPEGARPAAELMTVTTGKPIDFEDPRRGRRVRPREDRGLHVEGHARLRPPAPSAAAASPSARRGTPASRCRPKLVIMDLRDHLFAKAPYLIGGKEMPRRRARSTSPPRGRADGHARRARVGVRAGARVGAGAGRPPAGGHRRSRAG